MPARLCEHLKADGHRCGSPAMRNRSRCYFHLQPRPTPPPAPAHLSIRLPDLSDKSSIPSVIQYICQRLLDGSLDPIVAGRLLYGIQIILSAARAESRSPAADPEWPELARQLVALDRRRPN